MSTTEVIAIIMLVLTAISLGNQLKKSPPPDPTRSGNFTYTWLTVFLYATQGQPWAAGGSANCFPVV